MDIANAIKLLLDTGRASADFKIEQIEGDPTAAVLVQGGTHKLHAYPRAKARKHTALSLAAFCAIVNRFASNVDSVWHAPGKLIANLSDHYAAPPAAFDVVDMTLPFSPVWEILNGGAVKRNQKEFLAFLRQDLGQQNREALSGLAQAASAIKFLEQVSGQSEIKQGRESMGNAVQREVTGTSEFPDQFRVFSTVYSDVDLIGGEFSEPVLCWLDVDAEDKKFKVTPDLESVANLLVNTHAQIQEYLSENLYKDCPIYYGTP